MSLLPTTLTTAIAANTESMRKWFKKNSPAILLYFGDGLLLLAIGWGIWKSPDMKKRLEEVKRKEKKDDPILQKIWNRAKAVGPCLGPITIFVTSAETCHILSRKESSKRLAAVTMAYLASENGRKALENQTKELLGEKKANEVETKAAEDVIKNDETLQQMPKKLPNGKILTKDLMTGNRFYATNEDISHAEKVLLKRLPTEMWVDINELYYEITGDSNDQIQLGSEFGFDLATSVDITYGVTSDGIGFIKYNCKMREKYY